MNKLNIHRAALERALTLSEPVDELERLLAATPDGGGTELTSLQRHHISGVLDRFRTGQVDAPTVEAWAELIEMREDIAFPDEAAMSALHVLANLRIGGAVDMDVGGLIDTEILDRLVAERLHVVGNA